MRVLAMLAVLIGVWTGLGVGAGGAQNVAYPTAQVPQAATGRLDRVIRRGELIVGVKNDYPPWGQIGDDGPIGLEIDMAQDLADRLGVALRLVVVTANTRNGRLSQGVVDVVIATMGDTVVRRDQIDMIEPSYYSSGAVLYGPPDSGITGWDDVAGRPVCLTQGAYFNRSVEQEDGAEGRYFPANREARMALNFGRCDAWAFDDTAVVQQIERARRAFMDQAATADGQADPVFVPRDEVLTDPKLLVPWAIGVARGEGNSDLGRFLSDVVGEWHATDQFAAWQKTWNLPQTQYHAQMTAIWSRMDGGVPFCARDADGVRPADCLGPAPYQSAAKPDGPPWVTALNAATGIDLRVLYDAYDRGRLIQGLGLTLALSAVAIAGALFVGIVFGLLDAVLSRWGVIGQILLLPQRLFVTVARMTPPILQLYIVFFGLGGVLANTYLITPGAFVIAAVILSFYAGSTNAILLSHALAQERALDPAAATLTLFPRAYHRAFDGLVSTCVNIVKAAGMASAIAVAELISTINLLVSEGADATTLMNGLLVFYFLFVLLVMALFRTMRSWVVEGRMP